MAIQQMKIGTPLINLKLIDDTIHPPPPNHLLETKIFSKLGQNDIVQARPSVLHFSGYSKKQNQDGDQIMDSQIKKFVLINTSSSVHRMHIIEPQTKFFSIKYTKQKQLVPGGRIVCQIEFKPTEWRYYYDCIRIHTSLGDADNLIVPIHAYPAMVNETNSAFPTRLVFSPTPVQQIKRQIIPLRCDIPVEFEYQIQFIDYNEAFTISPMAGIIPANSEISVVVSYQPTSFCTSTAKLQVILSQFNSSPLICTLIGSSKPGIEIARDEVNEMIYGIHVDPLFDGGDDEEEEDFDSGISCDSSRVASPLCRARANQRMRLAVVEPNPREANSPIKVYKGLKVPKQLSTHQATVNVLMQKQGKLNIQDLREACLSRASDKNTPSSKQIKEALFEMSLRKSIHDERQNQLRWQVKLGCQPISIVEKIGIDDSRIISKNEYQRHLQEPIISDEFERFDTSCQSKRTFRDVKNVADRTATFDTYSNDLYGRRHFHLEKFKMVARLIIIRNRVQIRLQQLKAAREKEIADSKAESARSSRIREIMPMNFGEDISNNNTIPPSMIPDLEELLPLADDHPLKLFKEDRIGLVTFSTYQSPNVKDDMAIDALGTIAFKPTIIDIVDDVPYFDLKVAHTFQLLGYVEYDVHEAATNYVPVIRDRTFRTGAEDECVRLSDEIIATYDKEDDINRSSQYRPTHADIKPPLALFERIKYPSMHIFNPIPMLRSYGQNRHYSEISDDYQLCAIPQCVPGALPLQKPFLHRQDVIKGTMVWTKFPSQGLTALSNTPTLTNVWAPRWTDSFGDDMLPAFVPKLLDETMIQCSAYGEIPLSEDDSDIDDILTPEMIAANFHILPLPNTSMTKDTKIAAKHLDMFPEGSKMPSTNLPVNSRGPVPREKRECELSYFLKKKYNRLGLKIKARIENVNRLTTSDQFKLP